MTQVTTITTMLNMALLFAHHNGFKPRDHKDMDEQPADFSQTITNIQDDLFERIIEQGQRYACLYFNTDLNQFNLDAFDSHDEMIADYTDGNPPTQLIMASFTMPLDNEPCSTNLFTLEIVLG